MIEDRLSCFGLILMGFLSVFGIRFLMGETLATKAVIAQPAQETTHQDTITCPVCKNTITLYQKH